MHRPGRRRHLWKFPLIAFGENEVVCLGCGTSNAGAHEACPPGVDGLHFLLLLILLLASVLGEVHATAKYYVKVLERHAHSAHYLVTLVEHDAVEGLLLSEHALHVAAAEKQRCVFELAELGAEALDVRQVAVLKFVVLKTGDVIGVAAGMGEGGVVLVQWRELQARQRTS